MAVQRRARPRAVPSCWAGLEAGPYFVLQTLLGRHPPKRQVSPRVRTRWLVAAAAAALIASAAASLIVRLNRRLLPRVENLGAIAPEVADAARQALDSLAENPRDAARWGRFGMICEANGIVGAARDAYAVASSLNGSDAKWWYRLALVEARSGQPDDAIRDLRRAIELDPTYAPAHRRLGLWLLDR